jgi:hypothetical protein
MVLYFDTNVFGRLLEGSQADERRLLAWRQNEAHSVVLSVLNLQEVMGAEARNPDLFRRLVRTVLHWCERDRFVKPVDPLLKDDIDSYARGGGVVSPYISGAMLETEYSEEPLYLVRLVMLQRPRQGFVYAWTAVNRKTHIGSVRPVAAGFA